MLGQIVLLFGAIVYVNCQLISLQNAPCRPSPTLVSSCGCSPPILPPCSCGGQVLASPCGCNAPTLGSLDLLTALASLAPSCGCGQAVPTPCGLPSCGCSKAAPALLQSALAPLLLQKTCGCAPVQNVVCPAEYVLSGPVQVPSPCGCAPPPCSCGTPCSCAPLPCGCASPCGCALSPCGCVAPVGCTNPFLPAASPVSAMAPQIVSPLLPPVCPSENRALYLRKIPIPPPAI